MKNHFILLRLLLISCLLISALAPSFALNRGELNDKVSKIEESVARIEDQLNKEDRLREVTDIMRIDSSINKLNRKLDRVLQSLDYSSGSIAPVHGGSTSMIPADLPSSLDIIDRRLKTLESLGEKVEAGLLKAEDSFQKFEEVEKRTTQLKDELNHKLRKMMNIVSALYEMNKEIKTNFGSRSETPNSQSPPSDTYVSEFLVENLEELERKIKEQFSVFTTEIRNEITGLKIVAANVGSDCKTFPNFDDEPLENKNSRASRRKSNKDSPEVGENKMEDTLDSLVQTLGKTSREIRDEISHGMQTIDHKLANLTERLPQQCQNLEASESIGRPVKVLPIQDTQPKKSREVDDSCSRMAKNVESPKSCADLRRGGVTCDGVYVIFPKSVRAVRVVCDMTTDGGGWTMLMRRGDFGDKMTSFHKNWLSYKNGFGDIEGEFWLGNDVFHLLTAQDDNILRVHLEAFDGDDVNLTYSSFSVANEKTNYRLHIGPSVESSVLASNSLRYHSNHPFSTYDRKNDNFEQNCAATYKGGWWFNGCYFGFLTGEYFKPDDKRENWQGMLWYDWKGNAALKGAQMLIRPKNFTLS